MTTEARETLLVELGAQKNKAFEGPTPSMTAINAVKDILLMVPSEDKPHFKAFVEDLKNQSFEHGITLNGLEISLFSIATESITEENINSESVPEGDVSSTQNINYKDFFLSVVKCLEYELKTLKGYFFIHLQVDPSFDYKAVILHDNRCYYQPSQRKMISQFSDGLCLSIEDFKKKVEEGQYPNNNFIGLLILSTKINDPEAIVSNKNDLKAIMESFAEFNHLGLRSFSNPNFSDILSNNDQTSFLDEIEYVTSTILTNAELSNDEEKLIKKLFNSASSTLEYKVLKGGKSGSKVLEVRPRLTYSGQLAKRYVVKFGPVDNKNKIFSESKAFATNIENFAMENYHATKYEKNATVEGMKYTYASKDAIQKSYSYASILSDKNNVYYPERKKIIDDLFANEPFELWNSSVEAQSFKVGDLYMNYIKTPNLMEWIKIIKGLTDDERDTEPLVLNFHKIFDYSINTNKKICHGDLHSENFFKDENGIYLIDFGFTDLNHALVDHTALECSIKFKHVPRYIEMSVLMEIEDQLLTSESFDATFKITTNRKEILDYFELINVIRLNSLQHCVNKESRLEYLISLFIMTCRQFQYDDLNQLYALRSAEKIGERIIQLLDE
jgi:hypothetical protein